MATAAEASGTATGGDGPVLRMMNKRLRALRKKHTRIVQTEERVSEGKPLNKEQEDLLRSKSAVSVLIEEYEHLRQPLLAAVQEELSLSRPVSSSSSPSLSSSVVLEKEEIDGKKEKEREREKEKEKEKEASVDDLLELLYFGTLFDVKPQSEYETTMLMRTHERGCCITYDTVTDETTSLLEERDLDMISALSNLILSRPSNSSTSHKNALSSCSEHANLWIKNSDQPIHDGSSYTYAGLRAHLKKILASDYATATPEIKPSVDLAAEVGYTTSHQQATDFSSVAPAVTVESAPEQHQTESGDSEGKDDRTQCNSTEGVTNENYSDALSHEDAKSAQHEMGKPNVSEEDYTPQDAITAETQNGFRRVYHNQRGNTRGGGGRRGYGYGRGRGGRGGGGFQNGRGQYYDPGYYPRNYYNVRGRGGRSEGTSYNNHVAAGHSGRGTDVQLVTS